MLSFCYVLMICYLNSRLLGFFAAWIYAIVIIRYQLIVMIDIKWRLSVVIGKMSIQLCHLDLRIPQLNINVVRIRY